MSAILQYDYYLGYYCDGMHWNAVREVLSQRTQARTAFQNLSFPGIGIANTTPL
jgi:hypothetical protein